VRLIADEYRALPASVREHTTILAGNYGEAGALSRYGAQFSWLWGPPPAADTNAIVINMDPALLRREFAHVRRVATFWNGIGVSDDEQGAQIFVVAGLKTSWAKAWPAFRDYS
jgi:hypothetical protein